MVSHTSLGGLDLSVGKGGIRFKKKASSFNRCIGAQMTGVSHMDLPEGTGGRYDKSFQQKFVDAAVACGANVSPAKRSV